MFSSAARATSIAKLSAAIHKNKKEVFMDYRTISGENLRADDITKILAIVFVLREALIKNCRSKLAPTKVFVLMDYLE